MSRIMLPTIVRHNPRLQWMPVDMAIGNVEPLELEVRFLDRHTI